ncbi:Metalloprotease [Hypoxylon sp. FL1857]|nr:Metalloprotease [Hypoxylon sp. FL1857]
MAPYPTNSVCLSQSCIEIASSIFSRLSPNFQKLDPCTDFEEMVCGGFREKNVVPPWDDNYSVVINFEDTNYILMKDILENPSNRSWGSPIDDKNFEKLVTGYNTCLNETAISEAGVEPLVTFLGGITENFPISAEEYECPKPFGADDHKSFAQTYLWAFQHSIAPFLQLDYDVDPFYPDTYIPFILSPSMKFSSSLYENEKNRALYETTIAQTFANVLPTNETRAAAKDLAHGLVELEGRIVAKMESGSLPAFDRIEAIQQIHGLDDVTQTAPEFDFASLLKAVSPSPVNRTIYPYPQYSTFLSETLANTTKPAIQAFFFWQAILKFRSAVDAPELQPLKEFMDEATPPKAEPKQRWQTCMEEANTNMAWLMSKPYVEVRFTDAIKKTVEELATRIQHKLADNVAGIEWMTEKVKAIAKQKVEAISQNIGYPTVMPNLDDAQSISDYYASFNITNSYFDNIASHSKWQAGTSGALFGTKQEAGTWPKGSGSALTINAFYYPSANSITIIAGTLQQMLLNPDLPAYMNYGALGTVVGHEFTHSLDANGRQYNDKGALENWWDEESLKGFSERTECLIKQYDADNVTFSDGSQAPVNGTITLSENIADTGGINQAWDAWLDKRREDPASDFDMPGLANLFTHEQLFYVSAAQFFCQKPTDTSLQNDLTENVHSPNAVRIKNMMANSKGFLEAFKCPVKEATCTIY